MLAYMSLIGKVCILRIRLPNVFGRSCHQLTHYPPKSVIFSITISDVNLGKSVSI